MPQPASGGSNGNGVEEAAGGGGGGKTKDLSHVPCKFFRVGGCTAGSACPFSHTTGPGERGEKDVCAWFVKGTCKFGHKCALAHVLPGQSPSMDRRNKKAAQMASGKGGKDSNKGRGEGAREGRGGRGGKKVGGLPITMSLKASISPNADFSSFAAMAENEEQTPKKEEPKSWASVAAAKKQEEVVVEPTKPVEEATTGTLPMSTPRHPLSPSKPPVDFGPIGSPPRSWGSGRQIQQQHTDTDADGGEMFLPGSLSDLLTADELARRVSKSVPAPSLLSATQTPPVLRPPSDDSIWASPPASAYAGLSPSNASGAFLSRHTHYPPPTPSQPDPYGDDRGAAMGVSLPQGLAAGYSRIHARPGSRNRVGRGGKTREWGASSYGTGAGSFGGSPLSASFFGQRPPPPAPSQGSYKAPGGLGGVSFKDRPVFGVIADMPPPGLQQPVYPAAAAPSFNAGRDRFADRAAGIPERTVEDDDLFVLDG
ncbi:hypothetical protein BDZ89DRAFT_1083771 [Hymenopellis radicata]|nr:hypothetical protein BDZ89DRAFT_1083771 [Hymenopellis radicata]